MNETLLSEVDWGAHNPDADDPEQLTGESIQSFLTFVVQLQWLVTLGRLVTHDRIHSTTPGAEPPRDARDSGSARSHSTHLETSSSNRP